MSSEFALLGLLLDGPKHGYELARRFAPETSLGDICPLEMSMLYALLKKEEKAGYIEAQLEIHGNRPPKRIFHLTSLGRAAFMEWVRAPVARNPEIRLDFLVKLYFARQLGSDDVGALIGRQIEVCHSLLERLQQGEEAEDKWQTGNYSSLDFEEEEGETNLRGKRSHPRPNEYERNREPTPEEEQFFKLVTELRIKQNQAIIAWLQESRRILSGEYY
ncbi:MAG: helix-turn-helix transcriptional regulator [Chloroflexota bacterium]